ncbi:ABC transporter permease [Lampropedia puyangensis]|uniref:ABC transporter permease n=1 Tax=Lampropedia puyangensis TaxID=1330072 RepID=A0A4S8F152_9BURK|nr:ABC transporter permease [Lampropedia puyangensis]THT98811.1 ABC transporter permease [Lampropedia puyangensis]
MKTMNLYARTLTGLTGVLVFFGGWLALSWHSENLFFPPLRTLLTDAYGYWRSTDGLRDIASTLTNLGWGLLAGSLSGAVAGMLIGQLRWLDRALTPLIEFVRSIPQVALVPFAISLFGIGDAMKVFIIALSAFWPILLNVSDGCRNLPRQWLDTATVFRLTRRQRQLQVIFPALLPRAMMGLHIALPLALIIAVTSEMIGADRGIGSIILNAQYTYEIPRMWSGVLVLGMIGCLLNVALTMLERALQRWIPSP